MSRLVARVLVSPPPGGKKPTHLKATEPWLQKTGTLDKQQEAETASKKGPDS